jgi:hypothetical protein
MMTGRAFPTASQTHAEPVFAVDFFPLRTTNKLMLISVVSHNKNGQLTGRVIGQELVIYYVSFRGRG